MLNDKLGLYALGAGLFLSSGEISKFLFSDPAPYEGAALLFLT